MDCDHRDFYFCRLVFVYDATTLCARYSRPHSTVGTRFIYYVVTGKRLELLESKLSVSQLAALRFASDEELVALVERTVKENLSDRQIKNSIVHWLPDHMRV